MDYKSGKIDLHIHSNASDGSLSPEQILHQAAGCGLAGISITDHDTLAGVAAALRHGIPKNLYFITGVEISAAFPAGFSDSGSMHLLGYGISLRDRELNRALEKQQRSRSRRNPAIVQRLRGMGIRVSMEEAAAAAGKEEIARPHIAALLVRKGYAASIDDAFDRFLAKGRPAYVDRFRIPAAEAIERIGSAGGIAVLAHPGLLRLKGALQPEDLLLALIPAGLQGIEAYYSGHDSGQAADFESLAEKFGMIVTGGSDFHGEINPEIRMGQGAGNLDIPYSVLERLRQAMEKTIPSQPVKSNETRRPSGT